jgi:hypothetical protein
MELLFQARIAFKTLVKTFIAANMLRHFNPALPIQVETNALAKAINTILS